MGKHIKFFVNVFLSITVIVFSIVLIYINQLDLEINQKIGKGVFYLKGYYKEGNEIITEQGIGVITIPLFVGLIVSMSITIIQITFNKMKKYKK